MTSRRQPRAADSELDKKRAAGKRLSVARAKLGLTQQQLAEAIGASLQTVKSYEGGRRTPSGKYAVALTRLGINLMYVFEGGTYPALLPEGEAREAVADLVMSASGDEAASMRQQRRADAAIDRFRAAQMAVAAAARHCDFQMPELIRQALILAVMEGMKQSALDPVMQMLRAQSLHEAAERPRHR